MNNSMSEQLFEAIETIVDQRLSQVKFDETIQCTIVKAVSNETNVYEVKNNQVIYQAIAKEGETYQENDVVYVNIPSGDYTSMEKIIIGKYVSSNNEIIDYIDPFTKLVIDKTWHWQPQDATIALGKYNSNILETSNSFTLDLDANDKLQTTLPGYDQMGIEFGFEVTDIGAAQGHWAASIILYNTNSQPIATTVFDIASGEQVSEYLISSDEIQGNPYRLTSNFKQRRLYNLPDGLKVSDIDHIKLWLYQDNHFDKPDGVLMVKDLKIVFGFDINKFLDAPVHLYVEGNYNEIFEYIGNEVNGQEPPNIRALIIDQDKKQIITKLPENQTLRWYQYVIGEPGDLWGGAYWQYINNDDDSSLFLSQDKYSLQNNRPTTKLKAVLCESTKNTDLDISKLKGTKVIDFRQDKDENAWNSNKYDREQIICLADNVEGTYKYYIYNEQNNKFKEEGESVPPLDFHIYYLNSQNELLKGQGNIFTFIHVNDNTSYQNTNIYYYESDGEASWNLLDKCSPNLTELKAISTSKSFDFTNTASAIIAREGQIQIVSTATEFFCYNNKVLVSSSPIELRVEPTAQDGKWPPEVGENPVIAWEIVRGKQIIGIRAEKEGSASETEKSNISDIGLNTIYCKLKLDYEESSHLLSTNNIIKCTVGGLYTDTIELGFGERSTQGTNYSFKIEPIQAVIYSEEEPIENGSENNPQVVETFRFIQNTDKNIDYQFKAVLATKDGLELNPADYQLEWDWAQKNCYWTSLESNSDNIVIVDSADQVVSYEQIKQYFNNPQIVTIKVYTNENDWFELSNDYLKSYNDFTKSKDYITISPNELENNNYHVALQLNNIFNSELPNPKRKNKVCFNEAFNITLKGYNSSGELVNTIDSKLKAKTWEVDTSSSGQSACCNTHVLRATCKVNALQREGNDTTTNLVTLVAYYPIAISNLDVTNMNYSANGIFELSWDNSQNLITNLENNKYSINDIETSTWSIIKSDETNFPYIIEDNALKLKENAKPYYTNDSAICIQGKNEENDIIWQQPLWQFISKFDYKLTNEWAGGIVTLDEDKATIMATALGAGEKNPETNEFTGVLMGRLVDINGNTKNGLYGFKEGINTFGLDAKTGDAYFKGKISAESGNIAGWTIAHAEDDDKINGVSYTGGIYNQKTDANQNIYQVGMKVEKSGLTDAAFYVTKNPLNKKADGTYSDRENIFYVAHDGTLLATKGAIGGWTIGPRRSSGSVYDSGIYTEFKDSNDDYYRVGMKMPLAGDVADEKLGDYAFYVSKNVNRSGFANIFGVSYKGKLKAVDVDIEGKIAATEGTIANLNIGEFIDNTGTYSNSLHFYNKESDQKAYRVFIRGSSTIGDVVFGVKKYTSNLGQGQIPSGNDVFCIDNQGNLTTSGNVIIKGTTTIQGNATINGIINASTGGDLGGWSVNLETKELYRSINFQTAEANNPEYMGTLGLTNMGIKLATADNSIEVTSGVDSAGMGDYVAFGSTISKLVTSSFNGGTSSSATPAENTRLGGYLFAARAKDKISNAYSAGEIVSIGGLYFTMSGTLSTTPSQTTLGVNTILTGRNIHIHTPSQGNIYLNGTLYTDNSISDARKKQNMEPFIVQYDKFFNALQPMRYQYIEGTSQRYHTGFIAQQVAVALENSGLTTQEFAGIMLHNPEQDDECWFLRRDEFIALNTWQIQLAKQKIAMLEERIATLEKKEK